jgi:hypothetical protein
MRGPLPRVSALEAGMKTHSWCMADSKLGLGPASWQGGKEAVRENHSGEASCRTAFLSSGHVGGERLGGLMDKRSFEQPIPSLCTFVARKAFQTRLQSRSECKESGWDGWVIP